MIIAAERIIDARLAFIPSQTSAIELTQTTKALGDVTAGGIGNPAAGVVEEADGDEFGLGAHVEPVRGAFGHGDEVAFFAGAFEDVVADVHAE